MSPGWVQNSMAFQVLTLGFRFRQSMAEADLFFDFCWADLVCVFEDWIFSLDVNCTIFVQGLLVFLAIL